MTLPESLFLHGPAGRLDARLLGPREGPPVLLLHPHPLFGGTMGSRLVYDVAVALADAGHRVLRFDFRGVGRSDGAYGEGVGETDDAIAAFDWLAQQSGRTPAIVGYSFGGAVACAVARRRRPDRLVLVAMPIEVLQTRLDPRDDAPHVRIQAHWILGDQDPFVSATDARRVAATFQPPAQLHVLPGAGHFLEPSHNPRAVAAVLQGLGHGARLT